MTILLADRIFPREKLYGLHQKFKSQVEILSLNHYIIHIVLVLLIQVFDQYFYHHLILKQPQHQVEEVDVHKLLIEKYHQQNERLDLNKICYYCFVIIQIFKKIIFFVRLINFLFISHVSFFDE